MSKRPTLKDMRAQALKDPAVKTAYDDLAPAFEMKRQMIAMRKAAGVTQAEMAEKLGTKRSNISRLESLNSDVSPRLSTIQDYARALGHSLRVTFEPARSR